MADTKTLADGVIGWEERGRKKRLRKLLANVKGKNECPSRQQVRKDFLTSLEEQVFDLLEGISHSLSTLGTLAIKVLEKRPRSLLLPFLHWPGVPKYPHSPL